MKQELRVSIIRQMLELIDSNSHYQGESGSLRVSDYIDPNHHRRELDTLFTSQPILVAHASQLAEPGSFITLDVGDRPLLINRDRDGTLHAFLNVCRHRGARLVHAESGSARAFRCPYHAWSYMDDGSLKFVPRAESFPDLDTSQHGLVELDVSVQAGFVWVIPGGREVPAGILGDIEEELRLFGLEDHVVRQSEIQRPACNWKLVVDAFSEGYHLQSLHKDSICQFFEGDGAIFEKFGSHSRSVGARTDISKARQSDEANWDFRAWTTPFYTLFPNTVLVFHPDWISRITVFPDGVDHCRVHHDMLVPYDADLSASYWDKTFALINDQVFAAEDIAACESIQSAARSGADQEWLTGGLETPVLWFHEACAQAMRE